MELNDIFGNMANVTAMVGNAIIFVMVAYGFFYLGRQPFFLAFLVATPMVLAMSFINTVSSFGAETALQILPREVWRWLIPATNALYPVAVIFNVIGVLLLLSFVKKTSSS